MRVQPFTRAHLPEAGRIALALWGDEYSGGTAAERELIYSYLPCYYFHADSEYNLAVTEDEKLQGFLLAHRAEQHADATTLAPFITPENRETLLHYQAYLDGNRAKEQRFVGDDELILAFFASARKGCGGMLMREFERRCRQDKIGGMVLWTDDTCDFGYYHHNGFTEVAQLPTEPTLGELRLTTYIFRKRF